MSISVAFLMGVGAIGKTLITLRAVLPQDKSLVLAFELMIVGLFAYVPVHLSYDIVTREWNFKIELKYILNYINFLSIRYNLRLLGTQLRALSAARNTEAWQHPRYSHSLIDPGQCAFRHTRIHIRQRTQSLQLQGDGQ